MSGISMRRLLALCRKESYQIVRDPSNILIAFVLPVMLLFLYGFAINLDSSLVKLGVLRLDDGPAAVSVARRAGFEEIGIDLIYGLPGQTEEMARARIRSAVKTKLPLRMDTARMSSVP